MVATDYQGHGGGGKHQYAVARTNGRDVINAARAAGSTKEVGAGKKTVVYGWSQGGGATIAAASQPEYLAQKGTAADGLEYLGFVALAPEDLAVMLPKTLSNDEEAVKIMNGFTQANVPNVFFICSLHDGSIGNAGGVPWSQVN